MRKAEVIRCRSILERGAQTLDDAAALNVATLYPKWKANTDYAAGHKVCRGGGLYRCMQAHTALAGWEPENALSLWERIDETHAGTPADPIPCWGNMALCAGVYYTQNGTVYRCIRDTVHPVVQKLAELVGLYVEAV